MGRKPAIHFDGASSSILAKQTKQVPIELHLPAAHPKQAELINAFDARRLPNGQVIFNPGTGGFNYTAYQALPLAYPDLKFVVGACGTKFGKALKLNELVPTPNGWTTMGGLRVGDHVFDENGRPTVVTYVTDPMYGHVVYDVVFSDGSVVTADAGHLWVTETHACRKAKADLSSTKPAQRRRKSTNQKSERRTTEEIRQTLMVKVGGKLRPNHSIPVVSAPLQYPEQILPVDPYVLGAWLGDGSAACNAVSGIDEQIHARVGMYYLRYQCPSDTVLNIVHRYKGLTEDLRALKVLNNKHVPEVYLRGSIEQRLALLQGLMDTDGTISKRGDCCFDNTNKLLADAVAELCCSLGIKVNREERVGRLDGVDKQLCYRVHFTTETRVFHLERKNERLRKVAMKAKRRYIVAVKPVASVPVKCIKVASPTHLFLVGKACIPTHNTYGCSILVTRMAWEEKDSLNWWVAPSYRQSEMAYRLVKRLLPKDTFVEYKADLRLELIEPDGGFHSAIEFKSAENDDNLRGFGVHFAILDEAARISQPAYESVWTTMTQTDGRMVIISTPKGRNWFYDEYQKGEKSGLLPGDVDENPEWLSIRMPTWTNPYVKPTRILTMKKNMPGDVFEQEIAARFMLESAGVFRGIEGCIKKGLVNQYGQPLNETPIAGHRYTVGVDLARKKDYTVIFAIDNIRRHVVYYARFNDMAWSIQKRRIIEVANLYNGAMCWMDGTGVGDPIVEDVKASGVKTQCYIISNRSKQELIEKLRADIEFGRVSFPQLPVLIKELRNYEYEVNSNGNIKYSAPPGQHDDTVIALALANHGLTIKHGIGQAMQVRGV